MAEEHNEEQSQIQENEEDSKSLHAYQLLDSGICGELVKISDLHAETVLKTDDRMVADDYGLVHPGFVFSAASFCAIAAINDPNAIVVTSESKFLSPIEKGNELHFFAKVLQNDTKKREVKVTGTLLGLKIFEGMFDVAVFDKHILKMKISDKL